MEEEINSVKLKEELENWACELLKGKGMMKIQNRASEYIRVCLLIRKMVQTAFNEGRKYQEGVDAGMSYLSKIMPNNSGRH